MSPPPVPARLVLDSSVMIAAVQPSERDHATALAFVEQLRAAQASGYESAFAPPELWLEVHVVERRLAASRRGAEGGAALRGVEVAMVAPDSLEEIEAFLERVAKRMRGRRPFSNATDLMYLWAASRVDAAVVTLDRGLLGYHGVVCDVTRPQHVRFA